MKIMFAMFVHEPAERMFLFSMKLARFSLMRVPSFCFENWNKAVRFEFI